MAFSDKNILITPNIGSSSAEPKIEFVGADAAGSDTITLSTSLTGTTAALSFEGSAGQLFSVSNVDSDGNGLLFSVNDKSGIPSLQVETDGTVLLNPNTGNVIIGTSTDDGVNRLQVTGNVLVTGNLNVDGNQSFADNETLSFGTGSDLQIFHDGSNSYIKDIGTGRLTIQSASDFLVANTANTQNYIYATESGSVNLYHSGSRKFETTATGIDVTGTVTADEAIYLTGVASSLVTNTQAIRSTNSGDIQLDAQGSVVANIDTNNNDTSGIFAVRSNGSATNIFSVDQSGNGIFSGNLTVSGTTTTLNTTDLNIEDNIIVLNSGETSAGVTSGSAGIEIERGTSTNAQWIFNESVDRWKTNSTFGIETAGLIYQSNTAPTIQQNETGVTNSPTWWQVADGGTWSLRLNNAGNYPLSVQTNATNDAITQVNIGYPLENTGKITAGPGVSTNGQEIISGKYSNGTVANFGAMYSSGGPVLGYAVKSSETTSNAFLSTSSLTLARSAYHIDGATHRWFCGASAAVTVGSGVATTERMVLDVSGNLSVDGDLVTAFSDERLKDFQGHIPNALSKIKSLNGYLYTNNEIAKDLGYEDTRLQVGVSAQEVQAVLPEAVTLAPVDRNTDTTSKSGEDYLTVRYERLVPLLIEAIKEQQNTIEALTARLDKLETA